MTRGCVGRRGRVLVLACGLAGIVARSPFAAAEFNTDTVYLDSSGKYHYTDSANIEQSGKAGFQSVIDSMRAGATLKLEGGQYSLTNTLTLAQAITIQPASGDSQVRLTCGSHSEWGAPAIDGLSVSAADVTINGLIIQNFVNGVVVNGSNVRIEGNTIGGNWGDGIQVTGDGANAVINGNYIGIDRNGTEGLGNSQNGISVQNKATANIGDGTETARNIIAASGLNGISVSSGSSATIAGNYIGIALNAKGEPLLSGNGFGISIEKSKDTSIKNNVVSASGGNGVTLTDANSTEIVGNRIGTAVDGTFLRGAGNCGNGIAIVGNSSNTTIGGRTTNSEGQDTNLGNVICGSGGDGIRIETSGTTSGTTILGNRIGVTASEDAGSNYGNGIGVVSGSGNTIGDPNGGANVIAHNQAGGVTVANGNDVNTIRGNSIYDNAPYLITRSIYHLGIDLGATMTGNGLRGDGVTPNSVAMSRLWQTHPVLDDPIYCAETGVLTVSGTLDSPSVDYGDLKPAWNIDFFANEDFNLNGHVEGQVYLGTIEITGFSKVGQNYVASFTTTFDLSKLGTNFYQTHPIISSTATDVLGRTSEFSGNSGLVVPLPSPALMSLGGLGVLAGVHVVRGRRRRVGR